MEKQCCFPWLLELLHSLIILSELSFCPSLILSPIPSQPCLALFLSHRVQNCHQDLYCPRTGFSPRFLHLSVLLLPFGCSCLLVVGFNSLAQFLLTMPNISAENSKIIVIFISQNYSQPSLLKSNNDTVTKLLHSNVLEMPTKQRATKTHYFQ